MSRLLVFLVALLTIPAARAQPDERPDASRLAVLVDVAGPVLVSGAGVRLGLGERWALAASVSRHLIETEVPPDLYLGPGIDRDALGVEVEALHMIPFSTRLNAGLGVVVSAARQSGGGGVLASGFYVQDDELRSELIRGSYEESARRVALQSTIVAELRVWRGLWVGTENRLGAARTEFSRLETFQFGDRTPRHTADDGAGWGWAVDGRLRAVVRL